MPGLIIPQRDGRSAKARRRRKPTPGRPKGHRKQPESHGGQREARARAEDQR